MPRIVVGPSCPLEYGTCRECQGTFVIRPGASIFFCGDECQARFEFERKRLGWCIYPPCYEPVTIGGNRVLRRYCSDDCCAKAYWDRRSSSAMTRTRPRTAEDVAERVAVRKQAIRRDRERWVPKTELPAHLQPAPPAPIVHVERPRNYVPGSLAFALLYGQQSVGKIDARSDVSEVRRTGGSGWTGSRNHNGAA